MYNNFQSTSPYLEDTVLYHNHETSLTQVLTKIVVLMLKSMQICKKSNFEWKKNQTFKGPLKRGIYVI